MLTSSITLNELKEELHRPLEIILGLATLLDKEMLVSNQKLYLQDLKRNIYLNSTFFFASL